MAIYPILKGQKFDCKNVIPPRASLSEISRPISDHAEGDLIDFGSKEEASEKKEKETLDTGVKPPLDPSHKSTAEIQQLLASTGSPPADGPLLDFHNGMKKALAATDPKHGEAEDSSDEFHDVSG